MLRSFFFLACLLPSTFAVTYTCHQCASTGLKTNWQLTGYPYQPPGLTYDDQCINKPAQVVATANTVECPSATCVEMLIPTGPSTWEALRGCHGVFTGTSNENYTQTITGVVEGTPTCSILKVDGRGDNGLSYCVGDDQGTELCNEIFSITNNVLGYRNKPCTAAPSIDCVQCSYLDGKGKKCKKTDDGSGKGANCALTQGKLNGHDYQESAPAFLLPTNKAESCLQINSNQTQYYNAAFGPTVSRSKRSINQVFIGQTCYCQTTGCNSAPTVLATSVTLLVVLALVPFFC